jgi:hypothetical protein
MANGALNITEMRFTFRKLAEITICFHAQQSLPIKVKASIIYYKWNIFFIRASIHIQKICETSIRKKPLNKY